MIEPLLKRLTDPAASLSTATDDEIRKTMADVRAVLATPQTREALALGVLAHLTSQARAAFVIRRAALKSSSGDCRRSSISSNSGRSFMFLIG
jgi:hypothetical protein